MLAVVTRLLGAQFDLSADSIWRHFRSHVSERRKAELLAGHARVNDLVNSAAKESKSLLEYLGRLIPELPA